ncbi:autotransporter domain-containing protein, partial [Escherichia coli]
MLLKLRKSRNLTVTELAQRSGVSQAMISKVERGTTDAGAGFEQTLTGMTVGIDSRNDIPEGIATLGAFMGYSHSHIGFDRGGHGSVDSYSLGGYASWEHESGFYLDGVVKLN